MIGQLKADGNRFRLQLPLLQCLGVWVLGHSWHSYHRHGPKLPLHQESAVGTRGLCCRISATANLVPGMILAMLALRIAIPRRKPPNLITSHIVSDLPPQISKLFCRFQAPWCSCPDHRFSCSRAGLSTFFFSS